MPFPPWAASWAGTWEAWTVFYALIAFVLVDYITGVMCAIADKKLSSAVGFKGICRKVLIFVLVGIGNLVDVYVLGEGRRSAHGGDLLLPVQ